MVNQRYLKAEAAEFLVQKGTLKFTPDFSKLT